MVARVHPGLLHLAIAIDRFLVSGEEEPLVRPKACTEAAYSAHTSFKENGKSRATEGCSVLSSNTGPGAAAMASYGTLELGDRHV